jgi:DNA-binding transcriptional regulator YiaG
MTCLEFLKARADLRMTQVELANYFGTSERTIRRYERGECVIPKMVAMLIRAQAAQARGGAS